MTNTKRKQGFSLIELAVVMGITALIAVVILLNMTGYRDRKELDNATRTMVSFLREARSRSVSQSSSTNWGVRFDNSTSTAPFYAMFATSYSTSTTLHYQRLPERVAYATSSLPLGSVTDIMFTQLTGAASASTSIMLRLTRAYTVTSSFSVASSGLVTF